MEIYRVLFPFLKHFFFFFFYIFFFSPLLQSINQTDFQLIRRIFTSSINFFLIKKKIKTSFDPFSKVFESLYVMLKLFR